MMKTIELFDFKAIDSTSGIINGGDTAFDKETIPAINYGTAQEVNLGETLNISPYLLRSSGSGKIRLVMAKHFGDI